MELVNNEQKIMELVKMAMNSSVSKKDFEQYIKYKRLVLLSKK
ncbi:hypothetical protein [Mesobacillus foraminis]|uniref:Uncharacterized protein n=1 Tax=Mesobacillus foraminis TaxID=279826 RepID=A0A4R2BDQ3_9BACI|nr:hypothetical protein [Mesobacillus foraminis]TCN25041.1 hypothetical protein EV146_106243 [Mesobacillus foraminis]